MMVVLVFPVADHDLRVQQRVEAVDVEALVAEPAVERLNVPVPPRRARWDVGQAGAGTCPVGHRFADELRPVVGPAHNGSAADGDEILEIRGEPVGGDRPLDQPADAFPGVLIDYRTDLDRPALFVGVELEVHRPHHVRRVRCCGVDGRGPDAFATPLLPDAEALVTPEALDLLVVHDSALGARIVIRASVPVTGAFLRPGTQPVPQRPVRACGRVALERRVLLLELLQALRVVGLQPAVLVTPPVVRLLGHPELPAHRRDIRAVGEYPVGLPELADDLFRGVTLPAVRHDLTSLPARTLGRQDDSQNHRTYETGSAQYLRTQWIVPIRTSQTCCCSLSLRQGTGGKLRKCSGRRSAQDGRRTEKAREA